MCRHLTRELKLKRFPHLVRRVTFTMGKGRKNFYAVRVGRTTGIYSTWEECEAEVKGYPGAVFKGFSTHSEACDFVQGGCSGVTSGSKRGSCLQNSQTYSSNARQRYYGNFTSNRRSGSSGSHNGRRYYCGSTKGGASSSDSSSSSTGGISRPVVYSDGCCYNNGFHGACGGIGVYWTDGSSYNVSEKLQGHQTNQRAELLSACRALETAIQQGHSSVEVRTDSIYTIKAMTEWIGKWKSNGWRTVNNEDVKNKEDIQRLNDLCQRINVKWTHVRGHVGVPGNEAADQLAKAGSLLQ